MSWLILRYFCFQLIYWLFARFGQWWNPSEWSSSVIVDKAPSDAFPSLRTISMQQLSMNTLFELASICLMMLHLDLLKIFVLLSNHVFRFHMAPSCVLLLFFLSFISVSYHACCGAIYTFWFPFHAVSSYPIPNWFTRWVCVTNFKSTIRSVYCRGVAWWGGGYHLRGETKIVDVSGSISGCTVIMCQRVIWFHDCSLSFFLRWHSFIPSIHPLCFAMVTLTMIDKTLNAFSAQRIIRCSKKKRVVEDIFLP